MSGCPVPPFFAPAFKTVAAKILVRCAALVLFPPVFLLVFF